MKSRNPDYFWFPGDPVTEEDRRILRPVLEAYAELGRTPTQHEVGQLSRIKARFRIWEHAVLAAGLPSLKDPAQVLLRRKDQEEKKRYLQENWPLSRNTEQEGKVTSRNTEQEGKVTSRNTEQEGKVTSRSTEQEGKVTSRNTEQEGKVTSRNMV